MLIRAQRNLGAAARNVGVAYAHTPYIAFSDDDTQWEPGVLERAVNLLDMAPDVGVLSACIQVGPTRQLAASCQTMTQSPLARESLPGPQLLGFMAGRSDEHTSELQSLMRNSYAVFCLTKNKYNTKLV